MSEYATTGIVGEGLGVSRYRRHRPERTLLYRIVAQYYPALVELLADQDKTLPAYVRREFEDYLRCGRLKHGFLRVRCESCHIENLGRSAASAVGSA